MSVPKSVVKFNKNGITYTSNVDYANYTIKELSRAALRDVGKLITRLCNAKALKLKGLAKTNRIIAHPGASRGNLAFGYWARSRETDLQIGIKHGAWYGTGQELGTSKMKKLGLLTNTVRENIPAIREIESKYLTGINAADPDLSGTSENDYQGSGDQTTE